MDSKLPNRYDSLTGLRAVLAIIVLIGHGGYRVGWLGDYESQSYQFLTAMGHFGVVAFFILSGFILTIVYSGRKWGLKEYFGNRFARIYPLYLVCLILAFPIDWFSPGFAPGNKLDSLGLSVVLQQSWFEFSNGRFNGPGWTLSVEFLFYALFPPLLLLQQKSERGFRILCALVIFMTAFFWDHREFYLSHRFPPFRVWEFLLGMALGKALLKRGDQVSTPTCASVFALLLLAGGILLGTFTQKLFEWDFAKWLFMSVAAASMIWVLAVADINARYSTFLASSSWVYFGEISYGVYLVHDFVQRYAKVFIERLLKVELELIPIAHKVVYILATLVISFVLASILYKLVEMPAREILRKRFQRS